MWLCSDQLWITTKLTICLVLVELVEALCLTGSLAKGLEEAGVAEHENIADLLAEGGSEPEQGHESGEDSRQIDYRVGQVGVEVLQRRAGNAGFDEAEHLVTLLHCKRSGGQDTGK